MAKKKPTCLNVFLGAFVTELKEILESGFVISTGQTLSIKYFRFLADAPARAFLFGIKYPTGFKSCSRCTVNGITVHTNKEIVLRNRPKGRVVFLETDARLRTDLSFRLREDQGHHNYDSIIEQLKVDMVRDAPLDPMHLVYLGVTRRILQYLTDNAQSRLSPLKLARLNSKMEIIGLHCPRELARKCRSLGYLALFKATEYRNFLLYVGPVVLQNVLDKDSYDHFITLHVAIKILSTDSLCYEYNNYAKSLLINFVANSSIIYGRDFVVYNVHGLIHIADDVARFGNLNSYSAFQFEDYLGFMKTLVRKHNRPLQQVVKRLYERSEINKIKYNVKSVTVRGKDKESVLVDFNDMFLSAKSPDNCVMLQDGAICIISQIIPRSDRIFLVVRSFTQKEDLYSTPISSSIFDIYKVSELSCTFQVEIDLIKTKVYLMPLSIPQFAAFPMSVGFSCKI